MVCQLKIEETKDKELIKSLMTIKQLFEASMPDEDLAVFNEGKWEPSMQGTYFAVYREDVPIGIIRLHEMTNLTADIHYHICPTQWGQGISSKVHFIFEEYLRKNKAYCKLLIQTPQCCRHVLQAAVREGFELEGILTSAISWRGKVENLVLLTKNIRK